MPGLGRPDRNGGGEPSRARCLFERARAARTVWLEPFVVLRDGKEEKQDAQKEREKDAGDEVREDDEREAREDEPGSGGGAR